MRWIEIKWLVMVVAALALAGGCSDDSGPSGTELGVDAAVDSAVILDQEIPGNEQAMHMDVAAADVPRADTVSNAHENIGVKKAWTLIQSKAYTLLDVREPSELKVDGHIAGAVNLPYTSGGLFSGYSKLTAAKGIVVYCRSGNRSSKSAPFLVGKGYKPIYNVSGGFNAWKAAALPWTK